MSSIQIQGNSSGTGVFTIASPNSSSNYTLTLPTATTTVVGTDATQTLTNKTLTTPNIDSAQFATVSGTAPIYPCRAWVNFNGTGTVAIRASGNVSSITDNGVGDYTVNFTTAMPDANYCWSLGGDGSGARANTWGYAKTNAAVPTTSALRVLFNDDTSTAIDAAYACVKIHR